VALATNSSPTSAAFGASARLLGALGAIAGIGFAVLSAWGLVDLAHHQLGPGITILIAVLSARWLLSTVIDEWSNYVATRIRGHWRGELLAHFWRPRREGERSRADLALAVERASSAPALALIATSARVGVAGLAVIFWAVGWLSTLITIALLAAAIPFYQRAGRRAEKLTAEYHQRRALLESRQLELLAHAPELRALGAVAYGADEIAAISDSEHTIAMRAIRVALESSLVTEFLSGVSIGLVAMVVGFGLLNGRLSLFHALAAVLVTSELFVHVRRYGAEFHRREDAASALALLGAVEARSASAPSHDLLLASDLVTEASPRMISLRVTPGSRTLVTGPSGAGKTTLLHTLLGWRRAHSGSVQRAEARVGYVSVESTLVSGSLWENLTLGADLDPAVVEHQLRALGLGGARFEDLTSELLTDGRGLSSGERVRLVLARCLLASPALVMLDDIAGVLDAPSRADVVRALDEHPRLAIIETTVDTPLLEHADQRIVVPG
jgi:ABC-type transport system involved in cytochrome bd biosynthesis fused ATPase/permease subunit